MAVLTQKKVQPLITLTCGCDFQTIRANRLLFYNEIKIEKLTDRWKKRNQIKTFSNRSKKRQSFFKSLQRENSPQGKDHCRYSWSPVLRVWAQLIHYLQINHFFLFVKSILVVILETSRTVILPPTVSVFFSESQRQSKMLNLNVAINREVCKVFGCI